MQPVKYQIFAGCTWHQLRLDNFCILEWRLLLDWLSGQAYHSIHMLICQKADFNMEQFVYKVFHDCLVSTKLENSEIRQALKYTPTFISFIGKQPPFVWQNLIAKIFLWHQYYILCAFSRLYITLWPLVNNEISWMTWQVAAHPSLLTLLNHTFK